MGLAGAGAGYDGPMRRFMIVVTLVLLLAVSVGIGIAVARWPHLWR